MRGRLPQSTVACLSMPSSIAAAPGCLGAICRSALATFASFICTIRAGADRTRSSVRQRVFQAMVQDADNEWTMIDSAFVRAHQHSAGAKNKPVRPLGVAEELRHQE